MTWTVHKFGGTSVANTDRYKDVAKIILDLKQEPQKAVVVSAMKGVTDALINMVLSAEKQNPDWQNQLEKLKKQHFETVGQLTTGKGQLNEEIQSQAPPGMRLRAALPKELSNEWRGRRQKN